MFSENKREKIVVLLTMCFALFMAMLDNTVVNVALPTLNRELGSGVSGLQWIVDGYVLAFASLLLTGGILGDRYGRKRLFLAGLATFTVASLLSGLSQSTGQLIAARALQGVGAALLMPGTLSIITVTFPVHERAKAMGIWAGVSGIALSLGPTLGGWLITNVGWESVFFLNVPIGVAGFVTASRVVRESRSPNARHLDGVGLLLGTGALFGATYGLIEANQKGWSDPTILASFAAAFLLGVAFVAWERRTREPMMPLHFFRIPAFRAGALVAFAVSLGMFGTFFFMSIYMQVVRGYSPFESGLRILPLTLMVIVTAPNSGRFAQRFGTRVPITAGLLLNMTGLLLLTGATATTTWAFLFPVLGMMGVGMGCVMAPMTVTVMNAVGRARAGLGSATTNTAREVGGVFGIALLGTLLTTKLKSSLAGALAGAGLAPGVAERVVETAGHLRLDSGAFAGIPPERLGAVQEAFSSSFLDGFHLALMVAAAVLAAAALAAWRLIPAGAPDDREEHDLAAAAPLAELAG